MWPGLLASAPRGDRDNEPSDGPPVVEPGTGPARAGRRDPADNGPGAGPPVVDPGPGPARAGRRDRAESGVVGLPVALNRVLEAVAADAGVVGLLHQGRLSRLTSCGFGPEAFAAWPLTL